MVEQSSSFNGFESHRHKTMQQDNGPKRRYRVLFAFSDTGAGHRSAALAIGAALEAIAPSEIHCEFLDILQATQFPILCEAPTIYDKLSQGWLPFYNALYNLTDGPWQIDLLTALTLTASQHHISQVLRDVQPDIVVCTHALVQRLVCKTRRICHLPCAVVTVITDLVSIHHSWLYHDVDLYVVPTMESYERAIRQGIDRNRIYRTGFPVHPKFACVHHSRSAARQALDIAEDLFTMLITSGGVGSGRMNTLVFALEQAFPNTQILVVTGKNHALYEMLQQKKHLAHTHIYGFVQNMETLMAASDVVVTKAGPGTLMEALVMRRPVIVTEAVGLQEQGNIDFVINNQLGFFCPTPERVVQAIITLMHPDSYAATVARLVNAVPHDGAMHIANILIHGLSLAFSEEKQP